MLFMYRVLENDDEGDPLDHGVVRAKDITAAIELATARIHGVLGDGWTGASLPLRLYTLDDQAEDGVLASTSFTDVYMKPVPPKETT